MKKQNIKFLLGLLAFGILLACIQTPEQIAEKAKNSTVVLVSKNANGEILGKGSGFFVERDQIVTNIHVVAGAHKVTARLVGKETEYTISGIVAFDAKNDLVILKTTEKSGKPLALGDSEIIQEDEPIVVVGNPGGVEGNVARGTIHGTRSDKWLRLKTGISEGGGASGGPVLNGKGRVIGIVGAGTPHYTYAIPSTALRKIMVKKSEIVGKPVIESLSDWQNRPQVDAYFELNSADNRASMIINSMKLNNIDEEQVKHLDLAIESYTTAIAEVYEAKKLNLSQAFVAGAYQHRGWLRHFRGAYDKAIEDFEEVIRLMPDYDSSIYYRIGRSKLKLGQSKDDEQEAQRLYKEAIEDLDEAIRLNPDNVDAYYNRGIAKSTLGQSTADEQEAQRLYKEAAEDFDETIRLNPDNVDAYYERAIFKSTLGQSTTDEQEAQRLYKEAVEDFDETIRLNPDNADLYYARAIAKREQGLFKFTLGQSKDDKEETPSLYEAAIMDLDKAIMDLGEVIKLKRDYADIGEDEALNRKQHYASVYHIRGYMKLKFADFHKSEGNKEEAQRLYREAIKDLEKLPD